MTTWITVCDTCKRDDWDASTGGETHGEAFAARVEAAAEGHADLKTRRVSCMMGCERACNVAIQADGKLGYVLGKFDGTAEDAAAVVEYATSHAASDNGQVPYRQWPQGVKGHFTSRMVPLPTAD